MFLDVILLTRKHDIEDLSSWKCFTNQTLCVRMHACMYCVCMHVHILQFGMSEIDSGNNFTLPFKLSIMRWLIHWNSFKIPTLERRKQKNTPFGKWYLCKMQCETLQDTETNGFIQMGRVPALYCGWLCKPCWTWGFTLDCLLLPFARASSPSPLTVFSCFSSGFTPHLLAIAVQQQAVWVLTFLSFCFLFQWALLAYTRICLSHPIKVLEWTLF